MSRGPRLEFAVGAFLLLSLASLLVLAIASTNGKISFGNAGTYELKARFTNIGQLPGAIGAIFTGAFTGEGAVGGIIGALIVGFRRAA